jgi:hypothetical protein
LQREAPAAVVRLSAPLWCAGGFMPRTAIRPAPWSLALALIVAASAAPRLAGRTGPGVPSKANGEWPSYNADVRGSRYMPLDQIDAANFNRLEVAWRLKTDNLGPRPEYKLEGTPLMVKGVVYAVGGTRRSVVALDARTGELKWIYAMDEGRRADVAPRRGALRSRMRAVPRRGRVGRQHGARARRRRVQRELRTDRRSAISSIATARRCRWGAKGS